MLTSNLHTHTHTVYNIRITPIHTTQNIQYTPYAHANAHTCVVCLYLCSFKEHQTCPASSPRHSAGIFPISSSADLVWSLPVVNPPESHSSLKGQDRKAARTDEGQSLDLGLGEGRETWQR